MAQTFPQVDFHNKLLEAKVQSWGTASPSKLQNIPEQLSSSQSADRLVKLYRWPTNFLLSATRLYLPILITHNSSGLLARRRRLEGKSPYSPYLKCLPLEYCISCHGKVPSPTPITGCLHGAQDYLSSSFISWNNDKQRKVIPVFNIQNFNIVVSTWGGGGGTNLFWFQRLIRMYVWFNSFSTARRVSY